MGMSIKKLRCASPRIADRVGRPGRLASRPRHRRCRRPLQLPLVFFRGL